MNLTTNENPFDKLVQFVERLARPTDADIQRISDVVTAGIEANYTAESNGDGTAWAELAPFTVRQREAEGFPGNHPILRRTGAGMASFTRGHPNHTERIEVTPQGWRLVMGSSDPIVILNAMGDITLNLPSRPMTTLSPAAKQEVTDALTALIKEIEVGIFND